APMGRLPISQSIEQMKMLSPGERDAIAYMERLAADPDESRRYFTVGFHNTAVRAVFPKYGDPLQFDQQVLGSKDRGVEIQWPEPTK
ncbi:MAG: site-specific recombinase, partial [Candidatus Afipia apatlaquensis]|nr:site-specific recombinase [Candidatus Afipia apatlaquensis]